MGFRLLPSSRGRDLPYGMLRENWSATLVLKASNESWLFNNITSVVSSEKGLETVTGLDGPMEMGIIEWLFLLYLLQSLRRWVDEVVVWLGGRLRRILKMKLLQHDDDKDLHDAEVGRRWLARFKKSDLTNLNDAQFCHNHPHFSSSATAWNWIKNNNLKALNPSPDTGRESLAWTGCFPTSFFPIPSHLLPSSLSLSFLLPTSSP